MEKNNLKVSESSSLSCNVPSNTDLKKFIESKISNHPYYLNIVHLNAQSLHDDSHYLEFCYTFVNSGVHVIAVSETFFKKGSKVELPGYNVLRNDRYNKGGGGVAVYVQNGISAKILSTSKSEYSHKPEYIILDIEIANSKILFAVIYRPPKVGYLEEFIDELFVYITSYKYLIVCGDINARFGSSSGETANILSLLNSCNLTCIPYGATYHTPFCDSELDIIATNCDEIIINTDKTSDHGFSAHDLLYACFDISVPRIKPQLISFRDFKSIQQDDFQRDADQVEWHSVFNCDSIDAKVELMNKLIIDLFDKHAPVRSVKIKHKYNPWMNGNILRHLNKRDRARKRYAITKSADDYESFRVARNKCKQLIRNSKQCYYHEIFSHNCTGKDMWRTIRTLGIGKEKLSADITSVSADGLNSHYLSVASVHDHELINGTINYYRSMDIIDNRDKFYFKYVQPDDIISAVVSISSKATGVDEISIAMINLSLPFIIPILCHIFDFSLQVGVFPSLWKCAQVTPVPKTSNPVEFKDFRPVSIICVFAKVFEKVVHKQIMDYCLTNNVLHPLQSGFRPYHSTSTALVKVTDDIRKSIDNRQICMLLLFDFSKAFDKVHHDLLITKMRFLGFSSLSLMWISSYLYERKQRVCISNKQPSMWADIITGVPQGSVLGPLLYLLYVNDLPTVFRHGTVHLYADDLQYILPFDIGNQNEAIAKAESETKKLIEYSKKHNLFLNIAKTKSMLIGSRKYLNMIENKNVPCINVEGNVVPYCDTAVNLGVVFDSTLSWSAHVDLVCKKVLGIICQLRRNALYLPVDVKKIIVTSLVLPHISYCDIIMSDMNVQSKIKLQRLQNACIRYIFNTPRYEHVTCYYTQLSWLKLDQNRILNIALLLWRVMNGKAPDYIRSQFVLMDSISSRNNRHTSETMYVPIHRTEKYSKSFLVTAAKIWNKYKLQNLISLNFHSFKSRLKNVLLKE